MAKNNLVRRMALEIKWLRECPYFKAQHDENDMTNWTATIPGPEGSPYENGFFKVTIKLSENYPFVAPTVRMKTRIFHPNINGESICIDILKSAWTPALTLQKVLLSISSLLTDPNPNDPLHRESAILFKTNRAEYDKTVRQWVKDYASSE